MFFLPLLEVLLDEFFGLLLHHLHADRPVFFRVDPVGLLDHRGVFLHLILLIYREYFLETPKMLVLVLISEFLGLHNGSFSLLPFEDLPLARQQPLLIDLFGLVKELVLGLHVDVQQVQGISYEVEFDGLVEGCVGREAGRMVDFEHDGLSLGVEHDVEP